METKWQIVLRNKNKSKQFKLNMISDGDVTQTEFDRMRVENPDYDLYQDYLQKKIAEIADATKFQFDQEEMTRVINRQMFSRIKAGNFKGLSLTDVMITLKGELALAQGNLADLPQGVSQSDVRAMRDRSEELQKLLERVASKQKE